MQTVQSQVTTEINYEIMAKAFWNMGSVEQAMFFECLRKEIAESQSREKTHLYMMGEMQWYYVADELRKDGKITPAGEMLMAMAAPLFAHLTEWLGRDGKDIPCAFYEEDRYKAERERDVMRAALERIATLKTDDFSGPCSFSAECFIIAQRALGNIE